MPTDLEVKAELINWNRVFSSKVLHHAGQKGLREEKSGNPEHVRFAVVVPALSEYTKVKLK